MSGKTSNKLEGGRLKIFEKRKWSIYKTEINITRQLSSYHCIQLSQNIFQDLIVSCYLTGFWKKDSGIKCFNKLKRKRSIIWDKVMKSGLSKFYLVHSWILCPISQSQTQDYRKPKILGHTALVRTIQKIFY